MSVRDVIANALANLVDSPDAYEADADVVLSDLEAAGYAIVPKEPTEAMRIAALCTHPPEFVGDYPLYEKCWRAMLAAAKEAK